MKHIVIIGGGITGLAAAHRLLERSHELRKQVQVTLIEAGSRVGGIVQTRERDGFLLEQGPDSFISEKPQALELARRLGLESRLIETNENHRRSFIVRQGRLLPVPEGFHLLAPGRFWPFITSGIFSWRGKARIAMDLLLPRQVVSGNAGGNTDASGDAAGDESLAHFVRRRLGREALDRMAQPMIGGIYTADPETLSLRATMPRFLEMERTHRSLIRALRQQGKSTNAVGPAIEDREETKAAPSPENPKSGTSGARYSLFLSFDRGMQVFTDKLAKKIADDKHSSPTTIRINTRAEFLELEREMPADVTKWKVRTNNETLVADAVCLALAGPVSARLLRDVDAQLASELDGISYASSATVNLAYRRSDIPHRLDGFGFVVPFIEKRSLIACTFSSVKFAGRAPGGYALLRAFVGGALQPDILTLSEPDLISLVRDDLRDLLGIERPPLFNELTKWEHSMPQYHVGHLERVRRIQERVALLPHLTLAGNAYSGLGIPDCISSGETAADQLIGILAE